MTNDLKVGETRTVEREITDDLIRRFADLSGDYNPIHLDEDFARKTRFGQRIAHGMLTGAFISAVLGNGFDDRTIVYLSQTMKFTAPVHIGDRLTITATITDIRQDKGIVTLEIVCRNQDDLTTLTGESKLMVMPG
jgi:3-hydroxybutyryl-CoA dehydratase